MRRNRTERQHGERDTAAACYSGASSNLKDMAKTPSQHRKPWTPTDDRQLKKLAKGNTPIGLIAYDLQRTEAAVRSHASEMKVSARTDKPLALQPSQEDLSPLSQTCRRGMSVLGFGVSQIPLEQTVGGQEPPATGWPSL